MWTPKKYRGWSGIIHDPNYKRVYTKVTLIDPEGNEIEVESNRYNGLHSVSYPRMYIKRLVRKYHRQSKAQNGQIVVNL